MTEATVWKWFSKFIRLRDTDPSTLMAKCPTCGEYKSLLTKQGYSPDLHAGHFISRDRKATKYDEKNVHAQCITCNTFHAGKQFEMSLFIDKKYGPGTAESLLIKSKQFCKRTKYDLKVLSDHYRGKVKELENKYGIK